MRNPRLEVFWLAIGLVAAVVVLVVLLEAAPN